MTLNKFCRSKNFWFNVVNKKLYLDGEVVTPSSIASIRNNLKKLGLKIPPRQLHDNLLTYALSRQKNPVFDFISSKSWDGQDRIGKYFSQISFCDSENIELFYTFWKRWLLGIMAKLYFDPRDTVNSVLVLQSEKQGTGKTRFFDIFKHLNEDFFHYYKTQCIRLQSDSDLKKMCSTYIWLLDEIDSLITPSNMSKLKELLTRTLYTCDSEGSRDMLTSFCGTTNNARFLIDPTGNRRFKIIPIKNIAYVAEYRTRQFLQQMLAQALFFVKQKERWWYVPEEEETINSKINSLFLNNEEALILKEYNLCKKI